MPVPQMEERLAALEAEVARLKQQFDRGTRSTVPWWEEIGTFANDPIYKKARELGQAYRRSLRPGAKKQRRKRNGRARHRSS